MSDTSTKIIHRIRNNFKAKNLKRKKALLIITLLLLVFLPLSNDDNPFFLLTSGYNVYQDNSVDADSDIDSTANKGTDGATSFTNAQTLNGDDQIIVEADQGVGPTCTAVDNDSSDIDSSADKGTQGTFSNAQDCGSPDSAYMNIQEANTGGAGLIDDDVDSDSSDVDSTADVGTQGTFSNAQGSAPDSSYMSVQENDTASGTNDDNDIDNDSSDVDSTADVGTQGTFSNAQGSAPDSSYMSITEVEYNSHLYYDANAEDAQTTCGAYTDTDDGVRDPTNPETSGDGNSAVCGNNDVHFPIFPDIPTTGLVNVTAKMYYDTGTNSKFTIQMYDDTSNVVTCTTVPGLSPAWRDCVWETTTATNPINLAMTVIRDGGGGLDPSEVWAIYIDVTLAGNNQTDFEYQWTTADNDDVNEEVAINIQTATVSGETLSVDEWDGSNWANLGTISSNGWNNFTATYLTALTYTIRIRSNESSDTDATAWNIDLITLHTWTNDYELNFEYQWTSADFDETTEEFGIFIQTASQGGENLKAYEWTGSTWASLGTVSSNSWNNFTATYLTSSTYTIKINDSLQSNEATQSTWNIDLMVLRTGSAPNYEIDFEYQWTTATFDQSVEEVRIYTGARTGTETLNINYWSGSWTLIGTITGTGWKNVTATGLTSATYTIQLIGATESGDTSQGDWDIDNIFIYTEAISLTEYPVNDTSDVDSSPDLGSHSNFESTKIKNGTMDTLSELSNNTHSLNNTDVAGYMIVGAGGNADWRSENGTISFWIYIKDFGTNRPWGIGTDFEFDEVLAEQNYRLDWDTGDQCAMNAFLTNDMWWFIAVTWNQVTDSLKLYVGNETSTPTLDCQEVAWIGDLSGVGFTENSFLKSGGDLSRLNGSGDDLRYWDIDRSLSDIQSDYNRSLNGDETGLRSWYQLDNDYTDDGPDADDGSAGQTIDFNATHPDWDTIMDLEVNWTDIPFTSDTEELAIYTGSTDAEDILVDIWNGTDWENLLSDLPANSWTNTSVSTYLTGNNLTIRFRDQTEDEDYQSTWEIDIILLRLGDAGAGTNYQLEWEHSVTSVDTFKDTYNVTIYGFSSNTTESFELQFWNVSSSAWTSPLTNKIGTTEQWYNQTIPSNIGSISTLTYKFRGDNETTDSDDQTTLRIDYSGIASWNFTMDAIEASMSITDYKQGSGNISILEQPLRINVSSGISYDIQVSATDGSGTPVVNNWLFFDSDSNPVSALQLTTSWQTLYSSLSGGDGDISFIYIWLDVPFGEGDQVLTMTLNVRIVKA